MRYIVEYIDDFQIYAAKFQNRADAEVFADQLPRGYYDFYEEAVVQPAPPFEVVRRTTRFRKINGVWTPIGP